MPEGVKTSGQPFEMTIFNKQGKVIFKSKILIMAGMDLTKTPETNALMTITCGS